MRRSFQSPSLGILLLLSEFYHTSTRYGLPPVTMSCIVAQVLIHLRLVPLPWSSSSGACLSAHKILVQGDYRKLLYSQVEHGDEWHLYYNVVSFMWKGRSLESRMGSGNFVLLLGLFTGATALTHVTLQYALALYFKDVSFLSTCVVGFSGVIFALKVLTTHYQDDQDRNRTLLGFSVNSKYAVWVELVLISLVSPNASFVGHLAGILVGLAYLYGPLMPILNFLSNLTFGRGRNYGRFSSTSASTGYRPSARSYQYSSTLEEEEGLRRATENSLRDNYRGGDRTLWRGDSYPGHPTVQPTPEELRRLRLRRFQ